MDQIRVQRTVNSYGLSLRPSPVVGQTAKKITCEEMLSLHPCIALFGKYVTIGEILTLVNKCETIQLLVYQTLASKPNHDGIKQAVVRCRKSDHRSSCSSQYAAQGHRKKN